MVSEEEGSWVKSSYSSESANCVEIRVHNNGVDVRNSKDPDGPRVRFTWSEWGAFLQGARAGEFQQ